MKQVLKLGACLALALTLAACGEAKLDTTDAQSFTTSIQKMFDSTQGKQREDFQKFFFIALNGRSDLITMSVLSGEEISRLSSLFNILASSKRPEELAALNGLTVSQVVDQGRALKITYLEGRLQEIQREIDLLKDSASLYSDYEEQLDRVEVTALAVAEPIAGPDGRTASARLTVAVKNTSDLDLIGLQRPSGGSPWEAEIAMGESRTSVPVTTGSFTGSDGTPVFPSPGVPADQEANLTVAVDVSPMGWPFPPEIPLRAGFPTGIEACLEGCDKIPEAEDAFRRMAEMERHRSLLTRELSDTRV
ncbi:MAG: hypothetical protein LBR80_11250 [Deltaproteobacteria bacterium]|jgi:hypothetical protein|nr:hypothetical protein [Deltaproteobacteria bacterium]